MDKVNVICIWWTPCIRGRDFNIPDIERLQFNVDRYMDRPYTFYCLTNYEGDMPVEKIMMKNTWPGWWGKMELYRSDLPKGRTLYIDQDTYIVDSLQPVLDYEGDLVMFKNRILAKQPGMILRYQAGIMLFTPGKMKDVYDRFLYCSDYYMTYYRGDQDLIGLWKPHLPTFPSSWMEKSSRALRMKEKPKDLIFITGQPKTVNFRDIPKHIKWIQYLI